MKWTWPVIWNDERGGWWRILATLALWTGGMLAGVAIVIVAMNGGLREALKNQPAYVQDMVLQVVGTLAQHGLALAACLLGIRWVHKRPPTLVFTDGRPFRFGLAVQSAVVWAMLWFVGTISLPNGWEHLARRAGEVPMAWWPVLTGVTFCAIALQALDEEVVFRGYLLTRMAAWVKRPWLAVCLMTLVFTSMHTHASLAASAGVGAFAIAFGAGCIRAGTLAPLVGMHAAQNALGHLWLPNDTNATARWSETLVVAVQLSIWFGWLVWATRRTHHDSCVQENAGLAATDEISGVKVS